MKWSVGQALKLWRLQIVSSTIFYLVVGSSWRANELSIYDDDVNFASVSPPCLLSRFELEIPKVDQHEIKRLGSVVRKLAPKLASKLASNITAGYRLG